MKRFMLASLPQQKKTLFCPQCGTYHFDGIGNRSTCSGNEHQLSAELNMPGGESLAGLLFFLVVVLFRLLFADFGGKCTTGHFVKVRQIPPYTNSADTDGFSQL